MKKGFKDVLVIILSIFASLFTVAVSFAGIIMYSVVIIHTRNIIMVLLVSFIVAETVMRLEINYLKTKIGILND